MNKLKALFLAVIMMAGIVFIGDAVSSNGSMSAKAQTVSSRRKRKSVYGRSKRITKRVYHKTKRGTKVVVRKTRRAGKKVFHKSKRGTKKVYRKTKHVLVG